MATPATIEAVAEALYDHELSLCDGVMQPWKSLRGVYIQMAMVALKAAEEAEDEQTEVGGHT